jgi:hypothetical protein
MKPLVRIAVLAIRAVSIVLASPAATEAKRTPCADLQLGYNLRIVHPGQVFDYHQSLVNCSDRRRTVRVRIKAFGPCEFPHLSSATYTLPPHFAVVADAIVVAPRCRGRYRVVGTAMIRGAVVDRAHTGFTVVADIDDRR